MEWLKKNNKSAKENQEIVNNNPFIPYSLIMDNKDIELLSKEKIDVFTSNPISIINRDSLENLMVKKGSSIISEGNIKFLISFNNKLLNEEELRALTDELKTKITEVDVELEEKYASLDLYEKKRNDIEYSSLSLEDYENTKSEIERLTDKVKELNETVAMLREEINNITIVINENRNNIANLKDENSKLTNKRNDFKELKTEYAKYLNNLEDNRINIEKINVVQSKIQENIEREKVLDDSLDKSKETINQYKNNEKDTSKELVNFEQYKTGNILKKDKEDLISEYGSLIKTITDTEAELNSKQVAATSKFKNEEEALIKKAKDYSLQENDYNKIVYSIDKESEIETEIETNEIYLTKENNNLSNIVKRKAVSEHSLDGKFDDLKSKYKLEVPKNKELLYEKDYDEEEAKLKVDKKTVSLKSAKMNKLLSNIDTNRNSLSDYNDLVIVEILEIALNYENLREDIGKVKRDLNNFKEPLETLLSMVSNPKALLENLNIISGGYHNIINKLTLDIELIKKEEDTVIESLLEYIKEVHENIDKIDSNSSITIKEKSIKMLNIKVQDWEENKEIYKLKLKEYIAEIRDQSLINLNKNESIENLISNKINIEKLYDEVVSISSIEIKLYKIEEDKQRKISWDEVSKNSGGEGFLSAFVILSSLLSYMRRDDTDIFSSREDGKVLIMDNPFAQTSSAHLLKPLIEVARKSNTQLICLSDLRGDAILNRFDNIYVLNLISSKMHMGEKYLKGEHIKGNEDKVEVMSSSRFKIEEQIRLF